jgi:ADP-ribose pyrophosphatase YjhB (NUDIX family)
MKLAAIVITKRLDKYVSLRCAKGRGIIMPGGKLEPGESLRDCARRECFEETGIKVCDLKFIYAGPDCQGYFVTAFYAWESIGNLRSSDEGEAILASKSEILHSDFGDYYETLFTELRLRLPHMEQI